MPDTAEAYIHRIGRTGRMAHRGTALSFASQDDQPMIRVIERLLGHQLERRKLAA
jgi:ATP-dependent RNA helicase RhlE